MINWYSEPDLSAYWLSLVLSILFESLKLVFFKFLLEIEV